MSTYEIIIEKIMSECSLSSKTYMSHCNEKELLVGTITAKTGLMDFNFNFTSRIIKTNCDFSEISIFISLSEEQLIRDSYMKNKIIEKLGVNASNEDVFFILSHLHDLQKNIECQMINKIKDDFETHKFAA